MIYREFDLKKDRDAVYRILNEVGWVHDKKKDKYLNKMLAKANTIVHEIDGEVEVLVNSSYGSIRYQDEKLKFAATTGVVASLMVRKQGLAGRLTAIRMALDAEAGNEVAGLCIFDQGFYNKLGYGNGNYTNLIAFTPSKMQINRRVKMPTRLTEKDFAKIHKNRENRLPFHGAVTLPEFTTKAEIGEEKENVGFGYFDENGNLTHHLWFYGKGKEEGPIWIKWMAYENLDQLMDLLTLLQSFGDQYHLIRMMEPPFIQMQDFLERPYLNRNISRKSALENVITTSGYWQMRILDLQACMRKTSLNCETIRFNLKLSDPIINYLPKDMKWQGISGEYVITLGKVSSAEKGVDNKLQTMKASVGAFTRLWYGYQSASSLSYSDDLSAPNELLNLLDKAICLPKAQIDWGF